MSVLLYFFLLHTASLALGNFKTGMLAFITAFIVAMLVMPPLIKLIHHFRFFDVPDKRKEHMAPIPTMGGIASFAGMAMACCLWFPFSKDTFIISFSFSITVLLVMGIMDDLKNTPARYKLAVQLAVASLMAFSGLRITSLNGLFGIYELPLMAQYTFTVLAIAGITNAFNLIDGIDGLAGGLGFMSLLILGLFLTLEQDTYTAIIAFALGGGLLGFLYYNFNPARIFMGDTGSLVLGFVISVLCIKLMQANTASYTIIPHIPIFILSIIGIPAFDTLRVFTLRIWRGKSPFDPDKTHIHHLLTNNGWGHGFTTKLICSIHAILLITGYLLKNLRQEIGLAILLLFLLSCTYIFQRLRPSHNKLLLRETKH